MSRVKDFTFPIALGDSTILSVSGDYIYLKDSNADIRVEVDNRVDVVMSKGDKLRVDAPEGRLFGFDYVRIHNESGIALNLTIIVGVGDFTESSISSEVDLSKASQMVTSPDATLSSSSTSLILGSNASRRLCMLSNLSAGTTYRVGDSATGAARGQPVPPGLTLTLEGTFPIHVYNPGAGTNKISIVEIND